jgi:hypothetical protein
MIFIHILKEVARPGVFILFTKLYACYKRQKLLKTFYARKPTCISITYKFMKNSETKDIELCIIIIIELKYLQTSFASSYQLVSYWFYFNFDNWPNQFLAHFGPSRTKTWKSGPFRTLHSTNYSLNERYAFSNSRNIIFSFYWWSLLMYCLFDITTFLFLLKLYVKQMWLLLDLFHIKK